MTPPQCPLGHERGLVPTTSLCRDLGKEKGIGALSLPRTGLGSPEIQVAPRAPYSRMPLYLPEVCPALTVILGVCMAQTPCLACTVTFWLHSALLHARKGMGAALSSSPWDMHQGQSPLFPSAIRKVCPPQRAPGSPGAQDPLWGCRRPDVAHLDISSYRHTFVAQKKSCQLLVHGTLGRKGGLGTCLGALGCTGRQGKAMGSLGKVPPGRNGLHELVWWCTESSGGPGEGAHLGVWLCTGGVLGCNGMDGNAMRALGKGPYLGKHCGAGVFSGVAVGCTGADWVALECCGHRGRRSGASRSHLVQFSEPCS